MLARHIWRAQGGCIKMRAVGRTLQALRGHGLAVIFKAAEAGYGS